LSSSSSTTGGELDLQKAQKQLTVLTNALRQPSAQDFVRSVIGGVAERITARFINSLLRSSGGTAATAADAAAGPR